MILLISLEQRFRKSPGGGVYANNIYNYAFFSRYLSAFDEVLVFARVCSSDSEEPASYRADGPGVSFFEVPYYVGPCQYLKKRRAVHAAAAEAVSRADAFMFRLPGMMGALIWKELRKQNRPYGVEVVGDPWEVGATCGGLPPVLKHVLRIRSYRMLRRQCAGAAVAAYVTRQALQKRYPPGGWSTHYSSIELDDSHILDTEQMLQRRERTRDPFNGKRPFRICHVGMMEAMYKAQDTLIEAAVICSRKGLAVEVVLIGDGRYRKVFEQIARDSGLSDKIHFCGALSSEQVRQMLDDSDIFVLPSLTEGLPRVLIEAMARGLPCLASRVGGNGELLADEFLFAARDSAALADKLLQLMSNYEMLVTVAQKNLEQATGYKTDALTRKRSECYRQLRTLSKDRTHNV